ncbi:MAG: hypothetical protein JXB13_16350 [Phycisphaerae bacterium]|nr:hypothetical protein [Phycisphaerae bacterium]
MASPSSVGVRFAFLAVLLYGSVAGGQTTFLVSTAGDNDHDGLTWATAKRDVQAGLDAASAGDRVWVAAGRYVELITLKDGVALYGGFAGTEEPATFAVADREITANETILDGNELGSVVTSPPGASPATRIDGFTITGGIGTIVSSRRVGGGVCCIESSPTIANNRVMANEASRGGGLYLQQASSLCVNNMLASNVAGCLSGPSANGDGGGLYSTGLCAPCVQGNVFVANVAGLAGGAVYCGTAASLAFHQNTLIGNRAMLGGGILTNECSSSTRGSLMLFNKAFMFGGAFMGCAEEVLLVSNCTLRNNLAPGWSSQAYAYPAALSYCNVQGGWDNVGCIDADPLFVRNPSPGPNGSWGNADDDYGDLRLMPGSPCIDAGSNGTVPADALDLDGDGDTTEPTPFDFAGLPRFFDDPATPDTGAGSPPIVDIGPYEYPGFAPVAGDLDHDGDVDANDMKRFTLCVTGPNSLPLPSCLIASLDTNSDVDLADFAAFQRTFAATP